MSSLVIDLRRLLTEYPNFLEAEHKSRADALLNGLSDSTVQSSFGGTVYDTARANALIRFDTEVQKEVEVLFEQFEAVNGNPAAMKEALDQIFQIAARERDSGTIDIVDFNYIKNSLCEIIVYYELPSQTCGTEENPNTITNQNTDKPDNRSVLSKVIRVVLIVVAVLAVVFVGLIVIFAIKARKQKQASGEWVGESKESDTPEPPASPESTSPPPSDSSTDTPSSGS